MKENFLTCETVRPRELGGGGRIGFLQKNFQALLTFKWHKAVHFVSKATNKLDSTSRLKKKNVNVLQGWFELNAHICQGSHFSTSNPSQAVRNVNRLRTL